MSVPPQGPKLTYSRAIGVEVASYPGMTDILGRLKAALADHYAIEHELGAGGMATVYLAEDLKHNRVAALFAAAGEPDRALDWLEQGVENRNPNMTDIGVAPVFESLRDDPRFQGLLRGMNLPTSR